MTAADPPAAKVETVREKPFHWRPMHAGDIDDVVRVAASAFPHHFEGRACFAEGFRLFPDGCFVLASGPTVQGYLIAYPWPLRSIPPLNSLLHQLPAELDTWYLHDLALHPEARGRGYSRPILDSLAASALRRGVHAIALVSVNASLRFWKSMGFAEVRAEADLARKLESYGEGSHYMIRKL